MARGADASRPEGEAEDDELELGLGPTRTPETDAQRLAKKHAARRAAREAEQAITLTPTLTLT